MPFHYDVLIDRNIHKNHSDPEYPHQIFISAMAVFL